MRLLPRLLSLSLALLGVLAFPTRGAAQTVQYRAPDGREFAALPDTGVVRVAARKYREERTLENALALGAAQSSVRQYRAALATYTEALERWPDASMLYRWRGHRRLTLRDFIGARADLQTAVQLDSTNYGGWYHLGIVEFVDGAFWTAAKSFRRAIPLAPDAAERAGSTDWLWQSLSRAGGSAAADSLLRARPDSIPAGNAYATRLRLYRGEIGPDALFGPADTAGVQRATLSFGLASWYLTRQDSVNARVWIDRALKEGEGWPSFGFIASEAQSSGRTFDSPGLLGLIPDQCVASLPASAMQPKVISVALDFDTAGAARHEQVRLQMALLAEDLARAFRATFDKSSDVLPSGDARYDWRDLGVYVQLIATPDGRVRAALGRETPLIGAKGHDLAAELAAALPAALSVSGWRLVLPDGAPTESAIATLSIFPPTTIELPRGASMPRTPLSFAVFSLLVPEIRMPSPLPGAIPRYPDVARTSGVVATVPMRMIVDTTGRVEPQSVREAWPVELPRQRGKLLVHYDSFRDAIVRAYRDMRFVPARVGGCKLRALSQQPFHFDLQR